MALDMTKRRRKRKLGKKLPSDVKKRATEAAKENEAKRFARSEEKLREGLRSVGGPVDVAKEVVNPFKPGGVLTAPPQYTWKDNSSGSPYQVSYDSQTAPTFPSEFFTSKDWTTYRDTSF